MEAERRREREEMQRQRVQVQKHPPPHWTVSLCFLFIRSTDPSALQSATRRLASSSLRRKSLQHFLRDRQRKLHPQSQNLNQNRNGSLSLSMSQNLSLSMNKNLSLSMSLNLNMSLRNSMNHLQRKVFTNCNAWCQLFIFHLSSQSHCMMKLHQVRLYLSC